LSILGAAFHCFLGMRNENAISHSKEPMAKEKIVIYVIDDDESVR